MATEEAAASWICGVTGWGGWGRMGRKRYGTDLELARMHGSHHQGASLRSTSATPCRHHEGVRLTSWHRQAMPSSGIPAQQ